MGRANRRDFYFPLRFSFFFDAINLPKSKAGYISFFDLFQRSESKRKKKYILLLTPNQPNNHKYILWITWVVFFRAIVKNKKTCQNNITLYRYLFCSYIIY